jgi:hypothetical protein
MASSAAADAGGHGETPGWIAASRVAIVSDAGRQEPTMIVELVTFKSPAGWDRARVLADAKLTIPKWSSNRDLLRKHFALATGEDEGTGAGIYIWPSIEAAKKAHDEEWREGVKKRTGGYPTIRYFDLFLLIDNEQGRVIEWAADGKARELEAVC